MKNQSKVESLKLKVSLFIFLLFTVYFSLITVSEAKVYIDITSPAFKKLPIAIQEFSGQSGREISDIIRNDLEFTGLFAYVDKAAYLENTSQPFNPKNWTPLGVDAVVKGSVKEGKELIVSMSLYDVVEGKQILSKEYKAEKDLIRPLAHTIANDVYSAITGQIGIFRSRIAFIGDDKGEKGIFIMDLGMGTGSQRQG